MLAIPLSVLQDIAVSASAGLLAAGLVSGAVQLVSFSCPQPADNADDGTTAAAGGSSSSSSSQLSYALSLTIDAPASSAAPSSKKKKAKHGAGEDAGGGEEDDEDEAPSCRAVCFMPGGNDWLLAGYSDKAVRAYDVRTGKLVHVSAKSAGWRGGWGLGCGHGRGVGRAGGHGRRAVRADTWSGRWGARHTTTSPRRSSVPRARPLGQCGLLRVAVDMSHRAGHLSRGPRDCGHAWPARRRSMGRSTTSRSAACMAWSARPACSPAGTRRGWCCCGTAAQPSPSTGTRR